MVATRAVKHPKLNLREKLFLYLFCYPPPGKTNVGENQKHQDNHGDPLEILIQSFGQQFLDTIRDQRVLDIGCGIGEQVLGLAQHGAGCAFGAEERPLYAQIEQRARDQGLSDRVRFTQAPIRDLGRGAMDVVISQNSFEHFREPATILADAHHVLKSGGKFYITFSPPWLNPFGVHQFFMIRLPWAHFIFSEKTILTVRKLYRDDNAERYEDVDGGLNQMTVRKFIRFVKNSGFQLEQLALTPIRYTPPLLSRIPGIREFVISRVSAVLTK